MGQVTETMIFDALKEVLDPELGYNIVDLGLVYGVNIVDDTPSVVMTMTTPGCPAADYIEQGAHERLLQLPGVSDAHVEVVWSPPWDPSMMSPSAKEYFGFA
jgi:metal-sulfur cluster biosynthetic enzyme